jgi:predicted amidophosphoribosyltransferase
MTARWLDRAAAHLFPSRCFACGSALTHVQLLGACAACWGSLAGRPVPRCRHCALPLPVELVDEGPARGLCARCVVRPLPFDRAVAAVAYDGCARRFLLRAKNAHRPEILRLLGAHLTAAVLMSEAADGIDGVVPVPSTPMSRWRRGFEPAREIGHELASRTGLPLLDGVLRKRGFAGPAVKALGAGARWADAGRRIATRRSLPGACVLLVDDVLTTGATATACAAALRAAGAVEVRVAVWARTPSPVFGGSAKRHL